MRGLVEDVNDKSYPSSNSNSLSKRSWWIIIMITSSSCFLGSYYDIKPSSGVRNYVRTEEDLSWFGSYRNPIQERNDYSWLNVEQVFCVDSAVNTEPAAFLCESDKSQV